MDPDCDFITLTGTAGTGKTLMTLAAGLSQVMDDRRYTEIIVTRVTVPVGEDIGFLPGTEEEKMSPWMGALDDNLEVLSKTWRTTSIQTSVRRRVRVPPLLHRAPFSGFLGSKDCDDTANLTRRRPLRLYQKPPYTKTAKANTENLKRCATQDFHAI